MALVFSFQHPSVKHKLTLLRDQRQNPRNSGNWCANWPFC